MNDVSQTEAATGPDGSAERWKRLYDAAEELRRLSPWETFSEVDLAEISLGGGEPYYCSFTGMYEERSGISIYKGHDGLVSFSNYINNSVNVPGYIAESMKKCMECTWGARRRLKKRDLEALKSCGKTYRGPDAWPLFRDIRTGSAPWYISDEQITAMTGIIEGVNTAFSEMKKEGRLDDLEEGERIGRRKDADSGEWINEVLSPVEKIEAVTEGCIITDELLLRRIRKKACNGTTLEFDMPFLPVPVHGRNQGGRPLYPRACILCDPDKMDIISQFFVDRREDPRDAALATIISYTEENGRPEEIFVRDTELYGIIGNLCTETGIRISLTPTLNMLDYYTEDLIIAMTEKE